jgi:RNA polymerase sigma-70 factor (ECF subfamily)
VTLGDQFGSVMEAARTGAEWALTALYRDLHADLLRYLRSQEPSEAEDLESQTWLDAAGGLASFDGLEIDFRRWMFTIARRRLIDLRRQQMRRRTDPVAPDELPSRPAGDDVEAEALNRISTEEALAMIAALPPEQAEVVLLRVLGGFSAAEVGAMTGRRPGTVRVVQHRALARLARDLAKRRVTEHPIQAM